MKEIEITTRVLDNLEIVDNKLQQLGFQKVRTFTIRDSYFCADLTGLNQNNIATHLSNCVLIREIDMGNEVQKKLTYKNKTFQNGMTISEEKINVEINDIKKAKALFTALNFYEIVAVENKSTVYAKDGLEFAFQDVTDLGLLLEYENANDFEGQDETVILKMKQAMLQEIKNLGIRTTDEFDVKKAYELISKQIRK